VIFISGSMREEGQWKEYVKVLKPFTREGPPGLLAVHPKSSHCDEERKTGGFAGNGNLFEIADLMRNEDLRS